MTVLRPVLLLLGVVALGAAFVAAYVCGPVGLILWLAMLGTMLVAGILFERRRYKPAVPGHPGPGWIATNERFVDPDNGEAVTVYYQPSTGERRYVGR